MPEKQIHRAATGVPSPRPATLRRRPRLVADLWPTVGEETAVVATLSGDAVDVDWLGRTLRGEEIGGYIPKTHHNSLYVWEAVEMHSWGWSLDDVADEIGVNGRQVLYYLDHAGVPRRTGGVLPPLPWWHPAPWWQFYRDAQKKTPAAQPG